MSIKQVGGGVAKSGGYIAPDELGTGRGTPGGGKFLKDNQTFAEVTVAEIDSEAATSGQALIADGSGGASWGDVTPTRTIRYYTANDTWVKPTSGFLGAMVICVGAGSGGGSGARRAAGVNGTGGASGAGGCIVYRYLSEADISGNQTVTVAATATGGAAQTVDSTAGNGGAAGGDTSFGALVIAKGATASAGGAHNATTTTSTSSGNASGCTPAYGPYAFKGSNGWGGNVSANGSAGLHGLDTQLFGSGFGIGCPGGGQSGGLNTGNTERNGGAGGGVYDNGSLSALPTGGTANATRAGSNGADNVANNFAFDINAALTHGIGSGGAGGASESDGVTAAGNGGNGGLYGAGGGGGGASANGANSGAGGNGAQGLCIVIEYGV